MGEVGLTKFEFLNGENFVVRTALPEDADKVMTFNKTIMGEAPYLLTTEAEFKTTKEQQKLFLQQLYDDSGKLAILAEFRNEIIGFLDFHNGHRQRIKHQGSFGMSVKKEYRNQGVGKALLKSLLEWAENNPLLEKICLEVFADNKGAINLYKNFGFVEEGVKRKAIKKSDGSYHDLIIMAFFLV